MSDSSENARRRDAEIKNIGDELLGQIFKAHGSRMREMVIEAPGLPTLENEESFTAAEQAQIIALIKNIDTTPGEKGSQDGLAMRNFLIFLVTQKYARTGIREADLLRWIGEEGFEKVTRTHLWKGDKPKTLAVSEIGKVTEALPETPKDGRWGLATKAEVCDVIREFPEGMDRELAITAAVVKYENAGLTREELNHWLQLYESHDRAGLRVSKAQKYPRSGACLDIGMPD